MSWIDKYVDAVILINLKHRTDRYEESMAELKRVGIDNVYHLEAIQTKNGYVGCSLSHQNIAKQAKQAGWKNVLIFEDDIDLHSDADLFKQTIESAFKSIEENELSPDMLYLGGNAVHHPHKDKTIPYHVKVSDHLYQLGGTKTTHAYVMYESLYDKIIDTYDSFDVHDPKYWHGDQRMNIDFWYLSRIHHNNDYNIYGVYPSMAGQRASHSDIMNRVMAFDLHTKYNTMLETNGIG